MYIHNRNGYRIKDATDPIWYSLNEYNYKIFCTLTFYHQNHRDDSAKASALRVGLLKRFLTNFRCYFKLNQKNFEFFYSIEQSSLNDYHIHLLFSNRGLEDKDVQSIYNYIVFIWNKVCDSPFCKLHMDEVKEETKTRLVRYVSKRNIDPLSGIIDADNYMSPALFKTLKKIADSKDGKTLTLQS